MALICQETLWNHVKHVLYIIAVVQPEYSHSKSGVDVYVV